MQYHGLSAAQSYGPTLLQHTKTLASFLIR